MLFVGNWAKLTDDELTQIDGDREQLKGKLQAKYECAKHKAKQERRLVQCS